MSGTDESPVGYQREAWPLVNAHVIACEREWQGPYVVSATSLPFRMNFIQF